jgi:UDP-3-O-[3-hydroxymyristoyl] N-acetylglucosamine deacetylase / 3-hydroxyacyl-[acyl-carrier-protein] dehydratase
MNFCKQKTLARPGSLSGTGLHTGKPSTVHFEPAPEDSGIRFLKDGHFVSSLSGEDDFGVSSDSLRCSFIGDKDNRILTVEHLLASLKGLGLSNLTVNVEGTELPGLDGSALPFVRLFKELGIVEQSKPVEYYRISEPIFCYDKQKAIVIYPAREFSVSYVLDYEHPYLRDQKVDFTLTPEHFEDQIAPARTFCTEKESRQLQTQGLGLGANPENTLVVAEDGSHEKQLRFKDECARHKILDILGDIQLLGFPVLGHVVAVRSGHALNRQLVGQIKKQRETMDHKMPMGVEEIKKVLPHRYPFLLVDRIIEMGEKHVVGLKNLSACEPYFQGHFPQKAVMPGVLMVEALAQVGGVLMLSKPENRNKIAYLASVSHARFRRIVVPGDQLRLEVEVLKFKARVGVVKGVAKVGNEVACEAEIMFSLAD